MEHIQHLYTSQIQPQNHLMVSDNGCAISWTFNRGFSDDKWASPFDLFANQE